MRRVLVIFAVVATGITVGALRGPERGGVEGHVRYPACDAPADLEVCAERVGGGEATCTRLRAETPVGYAYRLELPPGRWFVYSVAPTDLPGRRAYFTRAVTCGLTIACDDHARIEVEVRAGATVTGVDPNDWFDDEPPPPPASQAAPLRPMT